MWQRAILAVVLLSLVTVARAQEAKPYDFKGVLLAMSVSEFLRTPYPENTAGWAFPPTNRTPLCRPAIYRPGATKSCSWGEFGDEAALLLGRGGRATQRYSFEFAPDEEGVERLFEISVVGRVEANEPVLLALEEKFGPPSDEQTVPMRTRGGEPINQLVTTWRNDVSSIIVETPARDLDSMMITYRHHRLYALVQGRLDEDNRRRHPQPM